MSPPIDPTTAQASRSANERTVQEWLDTLLAGACDQRAFRMQVDDLLRGSADAAWEVLSVLDQYYRRGKIKTDLFHALKLHVERQALGAGEDSDTSAQSPLARDLLRASNMTVPVGATLPRPSLVPRPAAAAPDAATAPRRAERSDRNRVPAVGDVLRGRYRIVGVLGQGGMGTVFEAVDLDRVDLAQTSQKLAIKVLHTAVTMRPQLFAELRSEFQHLQSLSHPNIVRVHEFDRDGDTAFFTMELLLGSSLGQLIATQDGRTLDRSQALAIIRDVGAALVHAHSRGVVHGDINPQNIFVTRDGEVRVLDFGASHKLQHGPWIAEFELRQPIAVASPGYASCQQLEGEVAEARGRLQSGLGLDGVRALWETGRSEEGLQPAEAGAGFAPSPAGGARRSALHFARLVAKRQHPGRQRGGGVSQRSAGEAGKPGVDSEGTSRLGVFR